MDIHTKRLSKSEKEYLEGRRKKSVSLYEFYWTMSLEEILMYISELEEKVKGDGKDELIKDLYKDIAELNEELREYRK